MSRYGLMKKISIALVLVIFAAIVISVVLLICALSNGFKSKPTTFMLSCGKNLYGGESNSFFVDKAGEYEFKVVDPFAFMKSKKTLSVKVLPKTTEENNFSYTVDGEALEFANETDLTPVFDITVNKTSFNIVFPEDMYITELLTKLYADKKIDFGEFEQRKTPYFMLVVSNGESVIYLDILYDLTRLHLSDTNIVF